MPAPATDLRARGLITLLGALSALRCAAPAPAGVDDLPNAGGGVFYGPAGPVSLAITAPAAQQRLTGVVEVAANVTGIGEVTLLIDEAPLTNLEAPFTYELDTDGLAEGPHRLRLRAVVAGALVRSAPVDVIVDRTRPEVSSQLPEDGGEGGVERIELTFTEPLDPASIDATTVRLVDGTGTDLAPLLSLSSGGRRLTLTTSGPPVAPDRPVLSLSDGIADTAGNPLVPWTSTWLTPTWVRQGEAFAAGGQRPALAVGGATFIAWESFDGATTHIRVHALADDRGGWLPLGDVLDVTPDRTTVFGAQQPTIAVDDGGNPWVAWTEPEPTTGFALVRVSRWSNGAWRPIEASVARGGLFSQTPVLALQGGTATVAWVESTLASRFVYASTYEPLTDSWVPLGPELNSPGSFGQSPVLAVGPDGLPVVAFSEQTAGSSALRVRRWDGSDWQTLGGTLQLDASVALLGKALALDGLDPVVAWAEPGYARASAFVARWDAAGGAWVPVGSRLNLDPDESAVGVAVAVSEVGDVVAAWQANFRDSSRVYVKRWNGAAWTTVGGRVNREVYGASPAVALDAAGTPWVALVDGDGISVRAAAPLAVPPPGLRQRQPNRGCRFDVDADDPSFPQTLSATQCFADVPSRTPIPAAIPYGLQSFLWSDGTLKERAVVLPDGGTATYFPTGSWELPIGTVLIKTFLLERVVGDPSTVFPVETRFFTRAAGGTWKGYSYRWNDEGTEADLLDAAAHRFSYPVTSGGVSATLTHYFPARIECAYCHSGTRKARGLQTAQLNRDFDYGDTVDNQLRAWSALGLFGSTFTTSPIDQLPQLPDPADPTRGAEERVRSYMHANCSHCHPANIPALDLNFETPLASTGLCDSTQIPGFGALRIQPGDPAGSAIFARMGVRGASSGQMPCIGTDRIDPMALGIVSSWISQMGSCP